MNSCKGFTTMMRTKDFTPLFNTSDFIKKLDSSPVDHTHHIRILETILFPRRQVEVVKTIDDLSLVKTKDYYPEKEFYTLSSFLELGEQEDKPLPSKETILSDLKSFQKMPYLLGGNCKNLVDLGLKSIDPFIQRHKHLYGIDCSGLIYYVTNGHTPRNTSELMHYGTRVLSLQPLDLIVFKGHVLIYLGNDEVIESREKDGVVISNWSEREKEINKEMVFNRFHPQAF